MAWKLVWADPSGEGGERYWRDDVTGATARFDPENPNPPPEIAAPAGVSVAPSFAPGAEGESVRDFAASVNGRSAAELAGLLRADSEMPGAGGTIEGERAYEFTLGGRPIFLPQSMVTQGMNAVPYTVRADGGYGGGIGGLFERYGVPALTAAVLAAGAGGFGMPTAPGADAGRMLLADAGTVSDVSQGLSGLDPSWSSYSIPETTGAVTANSIGGEAAMSAYNGLPFSFTPWWPTAPPTGDKTSNADYLKTAASLASAAGALLSPRQSGSAGAADSLLDLENQRQANIAASNRLVNDAFSGYDDRFYSGIADAYKRFQLPLLEEQATEARRRLPLTVPSRTSSAYARKAANLETDIGRQEASIGRDAIAEANKRRGEVESTKAQLLGLSTAGAPIEAVAGQAASQAQALSGVPAFSPIADLFGKYLNDAAVATTVMAPPAQNDRPLLFSSSPKRSVRNIG